MKPCVSITQTEHLTFKGIPVIYTPILHSGFGSKSWKSYFFCKYFNIVLKSKDLFSSVMTIPLSTMYHYI